MDKEKRTLANIDIDWLSLTTFFNNRSIAQHFNCICAVIQPSGIQRFTSRVNYHENSL